MATTIVAELGAHRAYWEPFCGSMAALLSKPRSTQETVNDLHGDLTNLAWVLQDPAKGASLYRRLRRVLASEAELAAAEDHLATMLSPSDHMDEDRAYWYFVKSWMERSGFAGSVGGGRGYAIRFGPTGGSTSTRWRSAVNSIPAWRRRLEGVSVLRRDGFELFETMAPDIKNAQRCDHEGVAIYLDPPYLAKGAKYEHDFESIEGGLVPDDHARLADLAGRFQRARVVVSYYDHPRLADLYPADRWTKIDCSTGKNTSNVNGGASVAPEVLLVNGESYTKGDS